MGGCLGRAEALFFIITHTNGRKQKGHNPKKYLRERKNQSLWAAPALGKGRAVGKTFIGPVFFSLHSPGDLWTASFPPFPGRLGFGRSSLLKHVFLYLKKLVSSKK